MPYKMRKLPNKNKYRVYNEKTGEIYAYETTEEKAKKQLRVLRGLKQLRLLRGLKE